MASTTTSTTASSTTPALASTSTPARAQSAQNGAGDSLFLSAVAATNSNLIRLSKTVAATSTALANGNSYGELTSSSHYRSLMNEIAPTLRKPAIQRRIFSFKGSANAMAQRQTANIADSGGGEGALLITKEMLQDLPDGGARYSLLQGFNATLPEPTAEEQHKGKVVYIGKVNKKKAKQEEPEPELTGIQKLENSRKDAARKLQRIDVRKV